MPHSVIGNTLKYPYYIVPQVEEYKKLNPSSEEAKELARLIAANVGDIAALRLILGIDPPEFARFYPDMETSTPSTLDTIDAFLDQFGEKSGVTPPIIAEIGNEIPPTPFDKSEDLPSQDLKYLLKQHHYQEALMLIERQNLNNTEKSIYFAHQIRFIKKLMAIENYKNKLTKG